MNGVYLPYHKPKFAEHYALAEDAILDFCFGARATGCSDAPRELKVSYVELTPAFFNKLVEVSARLSLLVVPFPIPFSCVVVSTQYPTVIRTWFSSSDPVLSLSDPILLPPYCRLFSDTDSVPSFITWRMPTIIRRDSF